MRLISLIYLNSTFYLFFFIFSLVAIPVQSVCIVLSALFVPKRQVLKRLRMAILWYGTVVIRILPFPLVRLEYKKYPLENIDDPCVYICNHRSASDPFLMAVLQREAIQVVNIWPFRLPVLGIVARIAGYLSVREMPFEDFKARTSELLREGVSVIVFPEGTRSRDGTVGQFNGAIFRVALETRKKIIPLCITGNEMIPPIGSAWLRPGTIKIHQLKPLSWDTYGSFTAFKLKNHVRRLIIDEVAAMEQPA